MHHGFVPTKLGYVESIPKDKLQSVTWAKRTALLTFSMKLKKSKYVNLEFPNR